MSEMSRQGTPYRSTPRRGFPPADARYRPIAIRAVAAALEASRPSAQPMPESLARVWASREFD